MTCVTTFAPAKINLYLHITGQREDGYHTLDSLVAFANIGDRVTIEPAPSLTLTLTGPYGDQVPNGSDNLVLRAARMLAEHFNVPPNVHITLEKNLPVASGIGGGSADAAATLKGLLQVWNTRDISPLALSTLALKLGADVPVCLRSIPQFMGGIGEDLCPAPAMPPVWLVLANPGVAQPTRGVFKARTAPFSSAQRFIERPTDVTHLVRILNDRHNDLTAPAVRLSPQVQVVLDALRPLNGCLLTRMSGSGATCFALFDQQTHAQNAVETLKNSHSEWWVQAAPLMTEVP